MTTFAPSRSLRDSVDSFILLVSIIFIVTGSMGQFMSTRKNTVLPLVSKSSRVRILTAILSWRWLKSFSNTKYHMVEFFRRIDLTLIWNRFPITVYMPIQGGTFCAKMDL